MTALALADHPLLELRAFVARYPRPLASLPSPAWLQALLHLEAPSPVPAADDATRKSVRELLRHGGFKPSGRSKPASEFLLRAASMTGPDASPEGDRGDQGEGGLGSINLAVDLCNATSLHSGLPISVVDLERVRPPLRVAIAEPGSRYVFNPTGQEIRLDGLLCLFDAEGPCANPVKDSQRTKTHAHTQATLCLVWGAKALAERTAAATAWYRELHERAGAQLDDCQVIAGSG